MVGPKKMCLFLPRMTDPLETKEFVRLVWAPLPRSTVRQRNHCLQKLKYNKNKEIEYMQEVGILVTYIILYIYYVVYGAKATLSNSEIKRNGHKHTHIIRIQLITIRLYCWKPELVYLGQPFAHDLELADIDVGQGGAQDLCQARIDSGA